MTSRQTDETGSLRGRIDRLIAAGEAAEAAALLSQVWRDDPSPALAGFVASRFEKLRGKLPWICSRLAILRSFTVEAVVPLLRAGAAVGGIDLHVQIGDFNAYAQEILDPDSQLYHFDPHIVILAVQTRDIAPELWRDFAGLSPKDVEACTERVTGNFADWISTFRSRSQAHVVLHTLDVPPRPIQGVLDAQLETGQTEAIRRVNRQLVRIAQQHTGVYVLDYDGLVAQHGRTLWYDEQKWLTLRMPIAADCLIHLADEWLRFIHPLTGKVCKALVCDLDNTLWGGVIGEDGLDGIQLGVEYPGAAYRELQRAILDLYQRGIILAICSKNNPDDAMEALEKHPDMLLRPEHFASLKINWQDKALNLCEIAEELNIGIDAVAMLDDSPVERQLVRSQLPEATVIDLPSDPMGYAAALRQSPVFQRLSLSAEDHTRGQMYAQQRQRTELQHRTGSLEAFYHSLEMEAEIGLVTPQTLQRVAQLTQKTNQFNLTTRRYSEQQISEFAADPACRVYWVRVTDRFGDNGIVGVAITRQQDQVWELDTFLLSCRVIGRTVETAMLATIAEQAREAGARRLVGWFVPTKKNAPARDFYQRHGFQCSTERDGASCWEFDITKEQIDPPQWIHRKVFVEGLA